MIATLHPFAPGLCVGNPRVTRALVQARTRELAVAAGRTTLQISQTDYERARTELTGETDMARQEAVLEGRACPARPASREEPS